MCKPNEVNNETIAKAAYYCAEELHYALSSLNMPRIHWTRSETPKLTRTSSCLSCFILYDTLGIIYSKREIGRAHV